MTSYLTTADLKAHNACKEGMRRFRKALRDGGFYRRLPLNDVGVALLAKHCTAEDMRWAWCMLINNDAGEYDPYKMGAAYAKIAFRAARKSTKISRYWVTIHAQMWAAALVAGLKAAYPDE